MDDEIILQNNSNLLSREVSVQSNENIIEESVTSPNNGTNTLELLVLSYNNGSNVIEQQISAVNPRTQEHQQYMLYVPIADIGDHVGVSSYDPADFIVTNGYVSLRLNRETILSEIARLDTKIEAETLRAEEAEGALDTKIENEEIRAKAAENILDNKIYAEEVRAKAAEQALDTKIDNLQLSQIHTISVNDVQQEVVNNNVNITVPTKTSDIENDGDGESPFATEAYVLENGGKIDSISVNNIAQTIDENKNVNITVPTQASDIHALPDSTKYGASIETNGTTISLKDQDGTVLSSATTQDTNTWRPVKVNGVEKLSNDISGNSLDLIAGSNITLTENNGAVTIKATDTTYNAASYTDLGLIKLGSSTVNSQTTQSVTSVSNRQYAIQLDSNNRASVNVPWVDSGATSLAETGSGNAYTSSNYDSANRKITFNKGETFVKVSDIDSSLDSSSTNPVQNKVIALLVPSQASSSNQLADKAFVNSSINALAAYYITRNTSGEPFQTKAQLDASTTVYCGGSTRIPTRNDYCLVVADITKATSVTNYTSFTTTAEYIGYHILYNNEDTLVTTDNKDTSGMITPGTTICYYSIPTTRYTYQSDSTTYDATKWEYQYIVNDTSLTAAQIAAINSGITSLLVNKLNNIEADAQVNTIESISLDGSSISPDGNKNVNIVLNDKYVSLSSQTLTEEQKAQVRQNIGAGSANATSVLVGGTLQSTINFDSDPQTQISAKVADVKVDTTSILDANKVADLKTVNSNYDAITNKLATENDLPTIVATSGSESISDGVNTLNLVTRNTNQTITGQKTFNASSYFNANIYKQVTNINPLTNPSSVQYNIFWWRGKDNVDLGVSQFRHGTNGNLEHQIDTRRIVNILKAGCTIKSGSTVQGTTYSSDTVTTSDIKITSNATLKAGSIIVAGSYIRGTLMEAGTTATSNNNVSITTGTAIASDATLSGTTYATFGVGVEPDGTGYASSTHYIKAPRIQLSSTSPSIAGNGSECNISTGNSWTGSDGLYIFSKNYFAPGAAKNNLQDLGEASRKWKDLYLGGVAKSYRTSGYDGFATKNSGFTLGNTPSSDTGLGALRFEDNAGNWVGVVQSSVDTSGVHHLFLGSRQATTVGGSSYKTATLALNTSPSGNWIVSNSNFEPSANGTLNLGTSSMRWNNLYLAGNLSDGTKSSTVANLVDKLYAFKTGSDTQGLSSYWFPLWKQTELVGQYSDLYYSIIIGNKYANSALGSGILEFGVRQNDDNTGASTNAYLKVMSGNLRPEKFKMIKRSDNNLYELWVNTTSTWQNCVGEMLKCTDRNSVYYTPRKGTFNTSLFTTVQTQPTGTETVCSCDLPKYTEDTTGSADPSPFADYYNKSTTDTLLGAKANNTASNLTDANVESWRSKLGIKDLPYCSIIHSTVPLYDASLKLADGSLISQNGTYAAFYNYMVALYNSGNASSCFVNETTYQTDVSLYGVCGKYVYDSTNHTIRIPKLKGILEGTLLSSNLGVVKEAGLPNITGFTNADAGWRNNTTDDSTGAFYRTYKSGTYTAGQSSQNYSQEVNFDASRSNSIYGNSSTVQPQTVQVYYYIVIASSVKTEIEVNIDNIATDLNNKADKTLGNFTSSLTSSSLTAGGKAGTKYVGAHIVTESWKATDGTMWYRKYSDGYKECGVSNFYFSSWSQQTLTLPITFSNTNYTVVCSAVNNVNTGNISFQTIGITSKTTTGFNFYADSGVKKDFYCCGY